MDKKTKKELKKEYQNKQKLSQEDWEEAMLENDSYYDIDMLNEANKSTLKKIKYWEEEYEPSSNMGKWWASIQIEKLKKKLKKYGK